MHSSDKSISAPASANLAIQSDPNSRRSGTSPAANAATIFWKPLSHVRSVTSTMYSGFSSSNSFTACVITAFTRGSVQNCQNLITVLPDVSCPCPPQLKMARKPRTKAGKSMFQSDFRVFCPVLSLVDLSIVMSSKQPVNGPVVKWEAFRAGSFRFVRFPTLRVFVVGGRHESVILGLLWIAESADSQ